MEKKTQLLPQFNNKIVSALKYNPMDYPYYIYTEIKWYSHISLGFKPKLLGTLSSLVNKGLYIKHVGGGSGGHFFFGGGRGHEVF